MYQSKGDRRVATIFIRLFLAVDQTISFLRDVRFCGRLEFSLLIVLAKRFDEGKYSQWKLSVSFLPWRNGTSHGGQKNVEGSLGSRTGSKRKTCLANRARFPAKETNLS